MIAEAEEGKSVGRKKKPYETKQVRMAADLVDDISVLAAMKGQDTPDYLTGLLRPIIVKELADALKERQQRLQQAKKQASKD